jgi:hypothetical protein
MKVEGTINHPDAVPKALVDLPTDLVLMAGQSNMVGYHSRIDELAPRWRRPVPGAAIWRRGQWRQLGPDAANAQSAFGPEIGFAHHWTTLRGPGLGIVKLARTATWLATDWDPAKPDGLYARLVARTRAALCAGPARLRGLIWMQGEADALDPATAIAYGANFHRFVECLRADLGVPDLPVVVGIINPPADPFAHAAPVRNSLRRSGIVGVSAISCAGLTRKTDGLHYDGSGLMRLGRRFAEGLHTVDTARAVPAPFRRWIWASEQYQAWYEGPTPSPDCAVVCLPFAVTGNGLRDTAFGQPYFQKRSIPAVYIRSGLSTWFQSTEFLTMAGMIRTVLGPAARIATYGASMGGYGALLLSGRLNAHVVLAVAPQYSIDRAEVPFETRWKIAAQRIGRFCHRIEDEVAPGARKFMVFDPLNEDRRQIAKSPSGSDWVRIPLPLASHQVLQFLRDTKSLPLLLEDLFADGPDWRKMRQMTRNRRRESHVYWLTMAIRCLKRRPTIARFALDRCRDVGGPRRKLKAIGQMLAKSHPL